MSKYKLAQFAFGKGYISDLPVTEGEGYLRNGSENAMVTGSGEIKAFSGLSELTGEGARQHFLADNGYAGLGLEDQTGRGSIFKAINLLFYIGQGNVIVNGEDTSKQATTTFSYLERDGNNKFSVSSNSYQVGLPRPSVPTVIPKSPPNAGIKATSGALSFVIWRISDATGQPSLPSPVSTVVVLTNGSALIQFPTASSNNQDYWGVGVPRIGLRDLGAFYQLPEDLFGIVAESVLAYSRTVEGASIPNTSTTVTITDTDTEDQFTAEDIGRRISFDTYDSYITSITSPTVCECFDTSTSAASGDATVVHAIDGITRTVEIGYSDDDLFGQPFVPYDAFEPPDGNFAGLLYDTFFIEDTEGTIFYSIPNYFSFPRADRRIFTDEVATVYMESGDGIIWRLSNQTVSQIQYVGGERPLMYDVKTKNVGCKYPTNASIGYGARLLFWGGSPHVMSITGDYDDTFYLPVAREFDGWSLQTEAKPVVTGYDPTGKYECWMYGTKIMAYHAPSRRWCSPIDISEWSIYNIVDSFIYNEQLVIVVHDTDQSRLRMYLFNVGEGSSMTLFSNYVDLPREQATVSEVKTIVKAGNSAPSFTMSLIKNFEEDIFLATIKARTDTTESQILDSIRKPVRGVETLAMKVIVPNASGYATVDRIAVYGEGNRVTTVKAP